MNGVSVYNVVSLGLLVDQWTIWCQCEWCTLLLVYTVVSLVSLVPRGDREPLRCRMLMRETCDLCCLAMRIAASFLLILW